MKHYHRPTRLIVAAFVAAMATVLLWQAVLADDVDAGRRHWAYRPPAAAPLPTVRDATWPRDDIDRFLLARLETEGLRPVADALRETLLRRLYFDLTGLPPTPEEMDAFLADDSPDAYERLVDRLLASPAFGERWGRHWLDVVRFAESLTLRGFILKEAWRYRDYVIESFDRDVPYDQFLREQIAGDLPGPSDRWLGSKRSAAPSPGTSEPGPDTRESRDDRAEGFLRSTPGTLSIEERQRRLIATTVLMLGNTSLEEQDKQQLEMDLIDEQLDLIGRGFLAQTITCARCHDHKFDPIPTRDYYALAGILKNARALDHENVSKWIEVPLPLEPEREAVYREHDQALAALSKKLDETRAALKQAAGATVAANGPDVLAPDDLPGIVVDDADAKRVGEWQHSQHTKPYIGNGYLHDQDGAKGLKTLTFQPDLPEAGRYEVRLAYTPGGNRAAKVPVTVFSADGEKTIHVDQTKAPPIDGRFISLGEYRFERSGQGFVIVANEGTKGHVIADAVQFLPIDKERGTADADAASPDRAVSEEIKRLREESKRLEGELKGLKAKAPKRPMAMTIIERDTSEDLYVHIRGSVHNRGPVVPRGFLQAAASESAPKIAAASGGRRELAEWLTARDNPLAARVIVNRVWHWLFGAGLVRTTDNFGITGEAPSHPELLDHLAVTFMDDGWSIKRLIRRIVLSRTYRLSVADDPRSHAADPDNRLLWRANRRRLDAECLRDAMLAAAGVLSRERGGPGFPADLPADYGFVDATLRRSVYIPVFRNSLPDLFEVFDFADPSTVTGRRNTSTVAPQALFLMNHPFVIEQSRRTAVRLLTEEPANADARLTRAWRLTLGRPPHEPERATALRFLSAAATDDTEDSIADAWAQLIQSLFATLDFRYVE